MEASGSGMDDSHMASTDTVKNLAYYMYICTYQTLYYFQSLKEIDAGIQVTPACSDAAIQFQGVTRKVGKSIRVLTVTDKLL